MKCWQVLAIGLLWSVAIGRAEADGFFGRTDLTGTIAADIENYIKGGVFFCNGDGNADSINVYLEVQLDNVNVRCAIYERTTGSTWQLIDSSAQKSCAVDLAWFNFPLLEGAPLTDGKQYALVAWAEQSPYWNCRARSVEGPGEIADSMFFKSAAYGAWPTPTVPTLIWYFDLAIVCYYSVPTEPVGSPATIDEVVHRGAYIK